MPDFDVFLLLEFRKCEYRSHGKRQKGNDKRKICAARKHTLPLMTYQQNRGNTVNTQSFNFFVPYLFKSYAF